MTVLSIRAVRVLAQRHVHARGPIAEADLVRVLGDYGVEPQRAAQAAWDLVLDGQLIRTSTDAGPTLSVPGAGGGRGSTTDTGTPVSPAPVSCARRADRSIVNEVHP